MSRNEFLAILDMRLDELDDSHRADLMESTLKIMLDKPTWKERVETLKILWSEVHTSQEAKRREMKKIPKIPDVSTRLIIEPGVYKE